ncbi:MAG TPA: Ig-like domain-containing protein, partial [Solirubrobacterales bacterium]|nr:Ig-like domain-containing protein [Solirubrobacterales bacterium]
GDRVMQPDTDYLFGDNVSLAPGATMTVLPGTRIHGGGLLVEGVLTAVGAPDAPIKFEFDKGIRFAPGDAGSKVEWAELSQAGSKGTAGAWEIEQRPGAPAPTLRHLRFMDNTGGLALRSSSGSIEASDLHFLDQGEAIALSGSDVHLSHIDVEGSKQLDVRVEAALGSSFAFEDANLEPPVGSYSCGGQAGAEGVFGCAVAVEQAAGSPGPAIEFKNVWWGDLGPGEIEESIYDGEDYASLKPITRIADAAAQRDLFPPVARVTTSGASDVMGWIGGTLRGTAEDLPPAQTGVDGTFVAIQDLSTTKWWNGSFWDYNLTYLATTGEEEWSLPSVPLAGGGRYLAKTFALDVAGNRQWKATEQEFGIDKTSPITFELVSPIGAVTNSRPTFSWQASGDASAGLDRYEVFLDGVKLAEVAGGNASFTPTEPLSPGGHTWFAKAVDKVGNSRESLTRSFVVDASAPSAVQLSSPTNGAATGGYPAFSWTPATDHGGAGLARYDVYLDGVKLAAVPAGQTSYVPVSPLSEGSHRWSVVAVDAVGNAEESAGGAFEVDLAPKASLTATSPRVLTGSVIELNATGSAPPPGGEIANFKWDLDGDGVFERDTGTGGRTFATFAAPGDHKVAVRVASNYGATQSVQIVLAVSPAPPRGKAGLSIENGALYTRDPRVALSPVWPAFARSMTISNRRTFAGAHAEPLRARREWRLGGRSEGRKTVYVRFEGGGSGPRVDADSIIFDRKAPRIDGAAVSAGKLRISARDNLSGVAQVEQCPSRRDCHAWRRYRPRLAARPSGLFVRVRDRAGNVSAWRRVAR